MGLNFRRRVKILPGLTLNVGKRGASLTVGGRGASVNIGKRGTYANIGVPGTGLSYRTRLGQPKAKNAPEIPPSSNNNVNQGALGGCVVAAVAILFVALLIICLS